MATAADLIAALTLSKIFLEILPKSDFPGLISRISTLAEDNCESVEFESPHSHLNWLDKCLGVQCH